MRVQLELEDHAGFSVAIHAARSGDVALLGAVIDEIIETQVISLCPRPHVVIPYYRMIDSFSRHTSVYVPRQ